MSGEPDAPGRVGGIRAVPLAKGSTEQDIVIRHQPSFRRSSLDTSSFTGHHAAAGMLEVLRVLATHAG